MTETKRILRFLAVGALNTGFSYLSFAAFVLLGATIGTALIGSVVLAMGFNYLTYGSLVFLSLTISAIPRFLAVNLAVTAVDYELLRHLIADGLSPLLAQAFVLPVVAVLGYVGMRFIVFRQRGVTPA